MSFRYLTFGRHDWFKPARTRTDGDRASQNAVGNSGNRSRGPFYGLVYAAEIIGGVFLMAAFMIACFWGIPLMAAMLGDLPTWSQVLGIVGSW